MMSERLQNLEKVVFSILSPAHALPKHNPTDCGNCQWNHENTFGDDGHCYMFRSAPMTRCSKHKAAK